MTSLQSFLLAYLVNSIWQVPLVFFIAKGLARLAARCGAAMHHRIWVAALVLQAVLPACSFSPLSPLSAFLQSLRFATRGAGTGQVTAVSGAGSLHGSLALPGALLFVVVALYLSTLVYSSIAFAWSLHKVHRLRRYALPLAPSEAAQARWNHYRTVFQVPGATLAASPDLRGPVTIGLRRPMILLPLNFQTAVAAEDQAVALAHEFAHMQRRDFAKNLLYRLLAIPIAWHPALRGTLAQIAETREILCDALAARAAEGPERYARSLLRLATVFASTQSSPTLHAIGIFDANTNTLETRIMILTTPSRSLGYVARIAIGSLSAAILLATCASAMALRMEISPPANSAPHSAAPSAAPNGPAKSPRVSAGVMEGNILKKVPPVYPPAAKEAKITGAVVLGAIIGKDGSVEQLKIVSGPAELQTSALDAVRQWVYKPYLLNGNPTEVETTITITYSLRN